MKKWMGNGDLRRRVVLTGGRSFDVSLVAERRRKWGKRGFSVWLEHDVGTREERSVLFERFVSDDDLWPLLVAISRVFERHARDVERRGPAQLVRVIERFGMEGFRALVRAERSRVALASVRARIEEEVRS